MSGIDSPAGVVEDIDFNRLICRLDGRRAAVVRGSELRHRSGYLASHALRAIEGYIEQALIGG